jgi:hypothetical protein
LLLLLVEFSFLVLPLLLAVIIHGVMVCMLMMGLTSKRERETRCHGFMSA